MSILKHGIIFELIGNMKKEINTLNRKVGLMERSEELAAADQAQDASAQDNQNISYVTQVTSIISETQFAAKIMAPNGGSGDPFIEDAQFSGKILTVDVPANITLPGVDDIVDVKFVGAIGAGTDADPVTAKYALFGAGGGGGTVRYLVTAIGDDTLTCRTFADCVIGGEDIFIARPFEIQKSAWDGKTINGITYTYSTPLVRVATDAASVGLQIIQEIIPSYVLNFTQIAASTLEGGTGLTIGNSPPVDVTLVDINKGARGWARTGLA